MSLASRVGWLPRLALGLALLGWWLSCAVNPVTGKRELMLLSEQDEIQLGQQTDREVVQTYGIYPDEKLQQYIEGLGQKMAAISHRPHLPYQFKLMDTPVINAFAVPGGFVYITRGILPYLNSEAEFAGVMGHEIGHIAARHSARQYSKAQLVQLGLGLGMILSEDFRKISGLAQVGLGLLFLKFSRDHERESDRLGVEYATRVGYDAREMANFFRTMKRMYGSQGGGGLPSWFSTHPDPEERVETILRLAEEWRTRLGNPPLVVKRKEYLQMLDGLVFGEDPRQGYLEQGWFYHPTLKFQFPVPAEWQVNNTPSQVEMVAPQEDAAILFTLAESNTPGQAANSFIQQAQATVISRGNLRVNGLPAHRVLSDLSTRGGVLRVLSYFIKYGPNVYSFHGYSGKAVFSRYRQQMEQTMQGFARLTDRKKIEVKPDRIKIIPVPRTGPAESIFARLGVPAEDLQLHLYLNGVEASDVLQAGELLKIVQKGRP